jgi:hypothetical protein
LPLLNCAHAFELDKGLILKDSWPLKTSNSKLPFLEAVSFPLINLVKFFFFKKLFFSFALIGLFPL